MLQVGRGPLGLSWRACHLGQAAYLGALIPLLPRAAGIACVSIGALQDRMLGLSWLLPRAVPGFPGQLGAGWGRAANTPLSGLSAPPGSPLPEPSVRTLRYGWFANNLYFASTSSPPASLQESLASPLGSCLTHSAPRGPHGLYLLGANLGNEHFIQIMHFNSCDPAQADRVSIPSAQMKRSGQRVVKLPAEGHSRTHVCLTPDAHPPS